MAKEENVYFPPSTRTTGKKVNLTAKHVYRNFLFHFFSIVSVCCVWQMFDKRSEEKEGNPPFEKKNVLT